MLDIVQNIDGFIMTFSFLIVVTVYISTQLELKKFKNKLIVINSFLILSELAASILIVVEKASNVANTYMLEFLYSFTILNSVIIYTTLSMFILKFEDERVKVKDNILKAMLIPIFAAFFFLIINVYTQEFYTINENKVFLPGKYFFMIYICMFVNNLFSVLFLVKNRKKYLMEDFKILITFEVNFGLLIILNGVFNNLNLLWNILAINVSIMFLVLQKKIVEYDVLTHALTRRNFDNFIENKILKKERNFGALFIDLDEFKSINDRFGHSEGDFVLKTFVELLYDALGNKVKVVRYGGDEFLVYVENASYEILNKGVKKLAKTVNEYNENSGKKYNIKYSVSSEMFKEKYKSFAQFLRKLDNNMYISKKAKKERYDRNCLAK